MTDLGPTPKHQVSSCSTTPHQGCTELPKAAHIVSFPDFMWSMLNPVSMVWSRVNETKMTSLGVRLGTCTSIQAIGKTGDCMRGLISSSPSSLICGDYVIAEDILWWTMSPEVSQWMGGVNSVKRPIVLLRSSDLLNMFIFTTKSTSTSLS